MSYLLQPDGTVACPHCTARRAISSRLDALARVDAAQHFARTHTCRAPQTVKPVVIAAKPKDRWSELFAPVQTELASL